VIQGVVTTDTHPPLYYLIIHLTRQLFGLSDFAFRYPSVLFGVLLIPLLYQLARRLPAVPSPSGRGLGRGSVTPSPFGRGLGRGSDESAGERGSRGVGARRGHALSLGLLVALLTTVNPLHVYYSQEARMYTLLVLLATGMSYVLWRTLRTTADGEGSRGQVPGAREEASSPGTWPLEPGPFSSGGRQSVVGGLLFYAILAALAVYTHYTIVFLVAAQALFWAWLLWRAGLRRVIIGALVVAALAAIPLIPYTLPRLSSGGEANYFPVSPLTVLQDVVRFFHLGLTVDFARPFVQALNWLAFGLLLLGIWAALRRPDRSSETCQVWFLLSWLLAVPLGLIIGSALFKPMYQGVRHIMAGSPAFLLLVGYGLWAIWTWLPAVGRDGIPPSSNAVRRGGLPTRPTTDKELTGWTAWRANRPNFNPLALVPLGLLLLGAAVALVNLYTDPAYAKDDFRAIVRFIETRAGGQDAIVYNNAVLLPLHEHYRLRPDLTVTALPAYPQFATGQEPELAALAADYRRLWFVTDPPADGRDDDALIHAWLAANLLEVSDRRFTARTTEARVLGYATAAPGNGGEPLCSPAPRLPGAPALECYHLDATPLTLPTLWVDLWWRGERPAAEAQLVFTLVGPDGAEQYRRAHPLLREGAFDWNPAAPNRLSYDLPLPPGLPPGVYTLAVGPEGGAAVPLGEVAIASTDTWPAPPETLFADGELAAVGGRPAAVWPNGLELAAVVPWDDHVLAGNNLPLTLFWRVGPEGIDLTNVRYRLEVIGRDGDVLRSQEARPGAAWLGGVAPGALLREVTSLYFRPETPPGRTRLRWTLLDGDQVLGEAVVEGRVRVESGEVMP
ncbi:MAG: glycosyltransferase family 39 protein, partial [Candidatus Promineofilum sp.]|nr:glycosyltransferase family 39 protein [Promineifilum sp.]